MKEKKYKVTLLPPTINEEIIYAESVEDCYDEMLNIINSYPDWYLNLLIEEIKEDEEMEDEENEQQENQ